MSKNTKPLNQLFNKTPVIVMTPDHSWPSPSEYIGVEIEIENAQNTQSLVSSAYWIPHIDHSLRDGMEYVFRAPYGGRDLTNALDEFFASGITYDCSPRTSIHIHINASDSMGVDDLRTTLALMYIMEPAVFCWADENRKYCGYCNPLTDLPPERLLGALFQAGTDADLIRAVNPGNNSDRYYGFNMAALARHGTLEFRYFPCVTDKSVVQEWIKFVMLVKSTAMQVNDLRGMLKFMQDADALREFLSLNFAPVFTALDQHMDYEDAVGRARYLYGAMLTQPVVGAPITSRPAQSRGFRAFMVASFPALASSADTPHIAPSEAEAALAEQYDLYRQAADRERVNNRAHLVEAFTEAAQRSRDALVRTATASAQSSGMTLSQYLAASQLNIQGN